MTEKAEAAQKVLSQLSTWMWKCDPPTNDQIENETYIRFKELLQVRRLRREKLITPPTDTFFFFPLRVTLSTRWISTKTTLAKIAAPLTQIPKKKVASTKKFVLAHADAPAAAFTIAISSKPIQTFASTIRPEEGTIGSNTRVGK
jgi:hypothetical protein